jgi:metalloendopeptidase OMA1, mitochondrial
MLSRALLRSPLRALPRLKPRALPRTSALPSRRQPLPLTSQRFGSNYNWPPPPPPPRRPGRKTHYQYDPNEARNAKPLLTVEQVLNGARSPQTKWIIIICSGSAAVFYFSNLETVPVSGRRRFNCYSDASVEKEGERLYKLIMQDNRDAILPSWDPRVRMVERVMQRLIPASGLESVPWEVHVIHSPGEYLAPSSFTPYQVS